MPQPTRFDKQWYDFLDEVAGAFYTAISAVRSRQNQTAPLSPLLAVRSGFAESPGWFMVQAAEFDPEPLTVDALRVRDTYASETIVHSLLELMASEKWFDRTARQEYFLTTAGRDMLSAIFARRQSWLQALDSMNLPTENLAVPLSRLMEGACALENSWCVNHSRRRAHFQEISSVGVIFQALEDFNAARDDAHMAAWQSTGVTGNEWETFGFVAAGTATNASALFDELYYRGYTRAEFADTLNKLAWRGWLQRGNGENYEPTPQGHAVRAEVEAKTDELFFTPWQTLSSAELSALYSGLETLRDTLTAAP